MTLNNEFLTSPINFFKKYAVNADDLHSNLGIDRMPGTTLFNEKYAKDHFTGPTVVANKKGGIRQIRYAPQKGRHVEFKFENIFGEARPKKCMAGETGIPIYYLPWEPLKITSMAVPSNTEVKYFLTAGLSGCSVFVRGTPSKPIVYHAGSSSQYNGDAVDFWKTCIHKIREQNPSQVGYRVWGISKEDYRFGGTYKEGYRQTDAAQKYEKWLNNKYGKKLKIQLQGSLGCVFGIKNDKNEWAFYLQERIAYEVVEIVKAEEGHTIVHPFQQKPVASLGKTDLDWKKETVRGKGLFKKSREVITGCEVKRYGGQPASVRQFFPFGGGKVDLIPRLTVD